MPPSDNTSYLNNCDHVGMFEHWTCISGSSSKHSINHRFSSFPVLSKTGSFFVRPLGTQPPRCILHILCIRCILYNIMTVGPSTVRKQNKQKNGNTPSHESRQHCAHDACYITMHVPALCMCVGWCFQRVFSTVVFSRCLQWVYSTGVFSGCHPELTVILSWTRSNFGSTSAIW